MSQSLLAEYFPILVFLAIAAALAAVMVAGSFLVGRQNPDSEKLSPYECGFEAFSDARSKFDVRYYLVAILFIIFDLEVAFLFPWAVALGDIGAVRLLVDDGVPRRADGRLHLRVEEGSAGMGVSHGAAGRRPRARPSRRAPTRSGGRAPPSRGRRTRASWSPSSTSWSTGRAPARCGR